MTKEQEIEQGLIRKLEELKYSHRPDIHDREALEQNFRKQFEALNRVRLTDDEFARLLNDVINPDVFACAEHLRHRNSFEREDGTPLHYQLVNLKDWCKNRFEVVSQLRINTRSSHHRYDVILLINGLPLVQIELKGLAVSPRRAMQQIVEYKHDPGNGYTNSLLCFMQLFIVSNLSETWYFANNSGEHFRFDADEAIPMKKIIEAAPQARGQSQPREDRPGLPAVQGRGRKYLRQAQNNKKINHLDEFADAFLAKCTLAEMISRYMVLPPATPTPRPPTPSHCPTGASHQA